MRSVYKASEDKFIPHVDVDTKRVKAPLQSYKFRVHPLVEGKGEFDKNDVPIIFKTSPDTLLNLASKVVDAFPLPEVYKWTNMDVLKWVREYGYPHYQNTFRVNLITGRKLLLIDAAALSAMNIKNFDHIQHIAYGIRCLFYYEMTKFCHSISLPPEYFYELYKLFEVKTGYFKYEQVRRTDLWRRMQLIREKKPNYSHWELLERWLAFVPDPKYPELIGSVRRYNLYKCKIDVPPPVPRKRIIHRCTCSSLCECHWGERDLRQPWSFSCLPDRVPDVEFKEACQNCMPPCTCLWTSKKFMSRQVLKCLRQAYPSKYGHNITKYGKYKSDTNNCRLHRSSGWSHFSYFSNSIIFI